MNNRIVENFMFIREKDKTFDKYQMVPELTLSFMVSGKKELRFAGEIVHGEAGNIGLLRRNELLKSVQMSDENGQEYESISIFFTTDIIRAYTLQHNIPPQKKYIGNPFTDLSKSTFIQAYFHSLLPYLSEPQKLTGTLAALKTNEAIELMLAYDGGLKKLIFDVSEPHKIDLEKFMNKNFLFNIPIKEFARLTGRSLSGFKRDFKTTYNATPEKWLRERRLEEAYFLITKKKQRASDVYYHVGFENLSHFSVAFKQKYGVNASEGYKKTSK